MIAWLAPGALAALALLAGPIVVHLLARRHARRVVFPASHFVRATQAAAVRLRRPSDVGLLVLRLAIVAAAVAAAARPLVLTPSRLAQWDARISRAVVVDTSASMPSPDAASGLAAGELTGVFRSRRIDTASVADGIGTAARWLATVPPSRREVVVISDFQRGAIAGDTFEGLPREIGVRFIRAGTPPSPRESPLPSIDHWRGSRWQGSMRVDAIGTGAVWTQAPGTPGVAAPAWLTVASAAADASAADRALRAAASFGVPDGDGARQAVVVFAGGTAGGDAQPLRTPWMAEAALALRDSDLLQDARVEVTVEERGGRLVVGAPIAATSTSAAALVRAVMLAVRPRAIADAEMETRAIPDEELARWRREAAPIAGRETSTVARDVKDTGAAEGQARWLWVLALLLLAIEAQVRRTKRRAAAQEAHAHAA